MTTDTTQSPTPVTDKPATKGLTAAEVLESRRIHGPNILTPPPRDPWWKLYLEKYEDPIIRILLVAAVIAILAGVIEGQYTEGIGIIIAVFLATTIGFINEYKAGQEFDILNRVSDEEPIKVIRDGAHASIPKKDLVVNDLAILEQGEEIPADGEVIESVSFQVNEASLTGESLPVTKRPKSEEVEEVNLAYPRHQVLRGTFVSDGRGLIRITTVGDASEIGKTARAAAEETETITPLNRQLARLGQFIGVFGFAIALLIFSTLTIRSGLQGDLGDQAVALETAVESVKPSTEVIDEAVKQVRQQLKEKYGALADDFSLATRITDDKEVFYLKIPLTNGQIYFLAITFLSLAIALARIWIPVIADAVELTGRKRPENAWLDAEGFTPWLQAVIAGVVVFGIALGVGFGVGLLAGGPATWLPLATSLSLLRYFMVAVTIIVVAVPEGLPMSVTLSLAYSMRKMTAANNLVRRLHACETVGAATVICSDKTGTLTMNKMKVSSFDFPALPKTGEKALPGPELASLAEAIAANSTANLIADENGQLTKPLGNPTESALLLWLQEAGQNYQTARANFKIAGQLTFSTERKYMATIGQGLDKDSLTLLVKGAPEIILGLSTTRERPNGQIVDLTEEARAELRDSLRAEQTRGMRTLGLAKRSLPHRSEKFDSDKIIGLVNENQLTFLGFFSIADPVRPEVPPAVKRCVEAGIKVKIVTGDIEATAREIAQEIGIIEANESSEGLVATGDQFMAMDDETALEAVDKLRIMSRARPLAKQRLVTTLQKRGEVVAVTGDGSNDAPALNHADVGLSMGLTGTSVAKEAADIILLDDSFASIVQAVMWGRSIYSNIQKFILFQLTINVLALGVALLGPFLGIQLPLTVTQMLWVNLIMDTFAALALASEPPDWTVMRQPPRNPEAFIVNPSMAKFIFAVGGVFLAMFLILALAFKSAFPMDAETPLGRHNLSIFFTTFVFLQFWNLFNARSLGKNTSALANLSASKMFLLIAAVIALGQIAITQVGGEVFRTTPLSVLELVTIVVSTSLVLWVGEIIRWLKRSPQPPSAVTTA
ncbi:MAG: calcium-translocating P-type ATPase, PMCA-type [Deltaproteobacteria bacterium]|jgi:Ca2+-transporting ATPase|nr:calcium-translocating P-type ATPase, PMCA-type [Deltaproteobacteria bacterium]